MNNEKLLPNKFIALEIIQTIIQHSDDNFLLRVALTEKLRDLLSCRLVVFVQYNVFSSEENSLSYEYSPDTISHKELSKDLSIIEPELKQVLSCTHISGYKTELISFKKFSQTIIVPVNHQGQHIGTILLFDVTKLYDINTIIETFENLASYISIVLFNTISYQQMENIISTRTQELSSAIKDVSDSNKSKSLFLANMSHEMRTPLDGIMGFLELLIKKESDPSKLDYLNKIDNASKSLLHLISEILDLSKLEFDSIELYETSFDLQNAIEDVMSLHLEKASNKGIKFKVQMNRLPFEIVIGDFERFKQILNNLISNSIKFTAEGSVDVIVESEVDTIKIDDEIIENRLKMCCDVIDTGIGIHRDNLEKIFEVFSQEDASTTRKFGGTGLGLSIVKRLVELMDGEIQVESELGHGSVFSFFVFFKVDDTFSNPSAEIEEEVEEAEEVDKDKHDLLADETVDTRKESKYDDMKILVVEDNGINSHLIGEILKLRHIYPDFAENGQEATYKTGIKDYDLILMDCQMPIMDGYQATQRIRRQYNDLDYPFSRSPHIIALTAAVSERDRKRCFDAGVNDYISKPINVDTIYNKIDTYIQKPLDT